MQPVVRDRGWNARSRRCAAKRVTVQVGVIDKHARRIGHDEPAILCGTLADVLPDTREMVLFRYGRHEARVNADRDGRDRNNQHASCLQAVVDPAQVPNRFCGTDRSDVIDAAKDDANIG